MKVLKCEGMKKYDIFISYRREDGAQYARIVQILLENAGYSVFLDYDELKDGQFGHKIESAISSASIFLIILTPKYLSRCWMRNDWVKKEILMAMHNKKKLIPIVPDNVPVNYPFFLNLHIKKFISSEQFSNVDFGSQLIDNIRLVIRNRIANYVSKDIDIYPDSLYKSILPLILNERALPVNYINFDPKIGVFESQFTSLLIGFEDFGQQFFKFLYVFSSFIDCKGNPIQFRCYAIDENMSQIEGYLRFNMPAIKEDELVVDDINVGSSTYVDKVVSIINELNYIVISIEDPKMALYHAIQIIEFCNRYRNKKLSKLCLVVKCNIRGYETLMGLRNQNGGEIVEIIPYVVDRKSIEDAEAKVMYEAKEYIKFYDNDLSCENTWQQLFGKEAIENVMMRWGMSRYEATNQINARRSNVVSEVLHSVTKLILMGLYDVYSNRDQIQEYYTCVESRGSMTSSFIVIREKLAMVEHERWCRMEKLYGYKYGDMDSRAKTKSAMCEWEYLPEAIRLYNYRTIDNTIKMAYMKICNSEPVIKNKI